MKIFLLGIVAFGGIFVLGFGFTYYDLKMYGYFNPKYEQVRRNTFEQSQAYVEGQRRDIENLYYDWKAASGSQKEALASLAIHRIAGLPESARNEQMNMWYKELRGE